MGKPTPRLSILVVDDQVNMRELLTDLLSAAGHDVYCAPNGVEALSLITTEAFDALICDVRMPVMDGMALHAEIAKRWPQLLDRIVLMTGYAGEPDVDAFLARSNAPVLTKPVRTDAVLAALAQLSSRR